MGYKPKPKIFRLRFADPEFEGLVIEAKSPSMGDFLDMSGLAEIDISAASVEDVAEVNSLFELFVDSVQKWNLEDDDDQPMPVSVKSLRSLDLHFVMSMIEAWMAAVQGASPDLSQPSVGGQPYPEASIPMENWSENLSSLHEPA